MKRAFLALAFCLLAFGSTAHAQRTQQIVPAQVEEPTARELTVEMQAERDALGQNFRIIADSDAAGGTAESRAGRPVCNYAAGERLLTDEAFGHTSKSCGFFTCCVTKKHHGACMAENGTTGKVFIITVTATIDAPVRGCTDVGDIW